MGSVQASAGAAVRWIVSGILASARSATLRPKAKARMPRTTGFNTARVTSTANRMTAVCMANPFATGGSRRPLRGGPAPGTLRGGSGRAVVESRLEDAVLVDEHDPVATEQREEILGAVQEIGGAVERLGQLHLEQALDLLAALEAHPHPLLARHH